MTGRVHPLAPVIGMDIDGTLGDWHRHFEWFLNQIYFPDRVHTASWRKGSEFSEALGMGKEDYRAAKLAYRQGGLKRCLPTFEIDRISGDDAVRDVIQGIRASGVQVWIGTTRPWLSLTTVDPDTQYWLDRNVGRVDGLIYGEDKWADLLDIVGRDRILGVVDDLPENIIRASELNLPAAIRRGPHNTSWIRNQLVPPMLFNKINELPYVVRGWTK